MNIYLQKPWNQRQSYGQPPASQTVGKVVGIMATGGASGHGMEIVPTQCPYGWKLMWKENTLRGENFYARKLRKQ
jgi:hypothetical protein